MDPAAAQPGPDGRGQGPAAELVLCCARASMDPHTAARIRTLASDTLNWIEFLALARHHGVLPLVCLSLQRACPGAVPSAIAHQLNRYVITSAARNRRLAEELLRLLALLEANHIPALPLKGPVLAVQLYGDLSRRDCVDVDILIRRDDALAARALLLSAGYGLETKLDARGFPCRDDEPEYRFTHADRRVQAELRWSMALEGFISAVQLPLLGDRRQPVRLIETEVDHLPPEEHLLVLCVHGGKERWALLKWVCDVAQLLHTFPNLDWKRLRTQARRLGYRRAVALGLLLAHQVLDAPLPKAVLAELKRDARANSLARHIASQVFGEWREQTAESPARWSAELVMEWERRRYAFSLAERVPDKLWNCVLIARMLRLCVRLLVPTGKDRRVVALPARLAFAYYALRPARVACQCIRPAAYRLADTVRRHRLFAGRGHGPAADVTSGPRRLH